MRGFRCRLFGHHYRHNTGVGINAVSGKPYFQCRCGQNWFALDWCRTKLTRRDTFAPYRLLSISDAITVMPNDDR